MESRLTTAEIFAKNARAVMAENGITIAEIASRIGAHQQAVSRSLSGRENLSIGRAARIAKEIGVPLSCLLEEDVEAVV